MTPLRLRRAARALPHARRNSTFTATPSNPFPHLPRTSPATAHPLATRPLPVLHDYLSPTPSHLLSLTLSPHLSFPHPRTLPNPAPNTPLPPTHHLAYFPPQLPEPLLLPDGSDAEQSPDPALYPRRMWAGGRIEWRAPSKLRFLARATLRETVERVVEKNGKVFATFRREMGEAGWEEPAVVEWRELVFLRGEAAVGGVRKVVRQTRTPQWSRALMPTAHLLFRFSALTFNAHRIHLEDQWCREREGQRGMLCHGPLAVVMMVEALQKVGGVRAAEMEAVEYRCLAPLVVREKYTVEGREGVRVVDGREERGWEVWILGGEEGALSVRGWVTRREEGAEVAV